MNEPISIGIICYNEEDRISTCLQSLQFIQETNPIEVIVVDNRSLDETVVRAEMTLKQLGAPYKIIQRLSNNLAEARNDIVRQAQHRWIYMIDADCWLDAATWEQLTKDWTENPRIAARGGSQKFPTTFEILELLDVMRKNILGHFGSAQMKDPKSPKEFVEHLSTTHVLYDKKALTVVKNFNPILNQAAEDLDLSLRLRLHGFRLQFIPQSFVWHEQARTWREWARKAFRNGIWQTRLIAVNRDILFTPRPWPGILAPFLIFSPTLLKLLAVLYFVVIALLCFGSSLEKEKKLKLFCLFLMTHTLYGVGEIAGLFLALKDFIRSKKEPNSTQI